MSDMRKQFGLVLPPIIMLLLLLFFAELVVRLEWIQGFLFASPSQVFTAFQENKDSFLQAFSESLWAAGFGFLASIFFGILIAFILCLHPLLERAFLPVSLFFQTVPIIAVSPLLVIWFGFGSPTVRAAAFIASFFPVLANMLSGLTQIPASRLDLFRVYRASRFEILFKLRLPQALPALFVGLEIAAGLSVIGAVVGEFIAGGGLGGVIDSARTQQRVDFVFAAVLLSACLGLFFVIAVRTLKFFVFRHRPYSGTIAE